jgi:hypothetical protein
MTLTARQRILRGAAGCACSCRRALGRFACLLFLHNKDHSLQSILGAQLWCKHARLPNAPPFLAVRPSVPQQAVAAAPDSRRMT